MQIQLTFDDGSTEELLPAAEAGLNLRRVLHGDERPDIRWLTPNESSFDIVPICPDPVMQKGSPVNIKLQVMDVVYFLNPATQKYSQKDKINWLGSGESGNDMFLGENPDGSWRIPSPGISGGARVNVLFTEGLMSAIQTLDATRPIPFGLPDYLCFTWYAIADRHGVLTHWIPRDGIVTPVMFNRSYGYVPTAWLGPLDP